VCSATLLRHVGRCWLKFDHFQTTARNTLQHGGQAHATCCDMLRWHIAIIWPGLKRSLDPASSVEIEGQDIMHL